MIRKRPFVLSFCFIFALCGCKRTQIEHPLDLHIDVDIMGLLW